MVEADAGSLGVKLKHMSVNVTKCFVVIMCPRDEKAVKVWLKLLPSSVMLGLAVRQVASL